MGNPPNAPWPGSPGPGAQPPYGPPPGPPGGPPPGGPPPGGSGWQPGPPGPFGPPPPPRGKGGAAGLVIALAAGGLVLVVVLVVAAVLVVQGDDGGGGGGGDVELTVGKIAGGAEATPLPDGALAMARPGVTSPVVEVYEDFACPHCGDFDRKNDPMLKELAVSGQAKVVFRPMVIFGQSTQPAYGNSLRAASALRCVGDGARWLSYQDALYAHQPASLNTPGYSTESLLVYAADLVTADGDFSSCVKEQRYAESVKTVSKGYISSGVRGTPSVQVNGRTLSSSEIESPEAMRRAIEAAS
ncbi:thioredoxin domain-containing protein [Spirillospora sp. NPDC048819]|uniref:DsbA family protein n=1 Tax=Spirillospora sp. NPDC048819 TaxID=3155268 RepID=UPI0033CDFBCF